MIAKTIRFLLVWKEKMAINKNHPLFQDYYDKCITLRDEYAEKRKTVRAQFPEWRGKDHPASAELLELDRQQHAELRALQQEYSFLFEQPKPEPLLDEGPTFEEIMARAPFGQ